MKVVVTNNANLLSIGKAKLKSMPGYEKYRKKENSSYKLLRNVNISALDHAYAGIMQVIS
jgi:hypothetical protein